MSNACMLCSLIRIFEALIPGLVVDLIRLVYFLIFLSDVLQLI